MPSDSIIIMLKCPKCNRFADKTDVMKVHEAKRLWQELVYQKSLLNASDSNKCCDVDLEYYIQGKLAREVLFS